MFYMGGRHACVQGFKCVHGMQSVDLVLLFISRFFDRIEYWETNQSAAYFTLQG